MRYKIIGCFLVCLIAISGCAKSTVSDDESVKEANKGIPVFSLLQYIQNASKVLSNYSVIPETDETFHPAQAAMRDLETIGEWTYFIYDVPFSDDSTEPALFRFKGDEAPQRVSGDACDRYEVVDGKVYFMDFLFDTKDHGLLYAISADGKLKQLLADELYNFWLVDDKYIYYTHSFDTYGVGLEGHSLHRIKLDGSDDIIAAYEPNGTGIDGGHFDFEVQGDWVYGVNYRMKLGDPATGFETLQIISPSISGYCDDWIYYGTNRLIKSRADGSEQMDLGGGDYTDSEWCDWYEVYDVDDEWVYYRVNQMDYYMVRKDGSGKTIGVKRLDTDTTD